MKTYNSHDAETQLPRLVELAAGAESFVIAKGGKPVAKVVALDAPKPAHTKRFGFMAEQIKVPEDFYMMGAAEIEASFNSNA